MIFLLLWFVVPITSMYGQSGYMTIDEIEGESVAGWQAPYLATEGDPDYPEGFDQNTFTTLPASRFELSLTESMTERRNKFSLSENQNFTRLLMNGNNNNVESTQQGVGHIMDLALYGDSNVGKYHQEGKNNYIFDRIGNQTEAATNVRHEISQYGEGLGIENRGIQTTPMIIKQRGNGMKLKITGPPN